MPSIIDYPQALKTLEAQGLVCNYHNSGAFGFPRGVAVGVRAYIGPEDPTIRPAARAFVRAMPPPFEENLARQATRLWREQATGPAWVMPVSHWAYELEFGSAAWMPGLLREVGIEPEELRPRNNGSPVEFARGEEAGLGRMVQGLLESLAASDFTLVFVGCPMVCTIHHHKQLWWISSNSGLLEHLWEPCSPDR